MHYLTYLIFLICLSCGQSLRGKNVRDATAADKLSFVVSIGRIRYPNVNFCTGTLISEWHVLTAEHCLLDEDFHDVEVTIGSLDISTGRKYRVEAWQTYDQWQYYTPDIQATVDDIAIMTLRDRVKLSKIKPPSVLFSPVENLHYSKVRVAGWGLNEDGTQPLTLKTAVVKVLPLKVCLEKALNLTGQVFRIPEDYFCSAADPWILTTCGDSGAPILNKQNQLVAINKGACPRLDDYPKEFADHNQMNFHLNLIRYRRFINSVRAC